MVLLRPWVSQQDSSMGLCRLLGLGYRRPAGVLLGSTDSGHTGRRSGCHLMWLAEVDLPQCPSLARDEGTTPCTWGQSWGGEPGKGAAPAGADGAPRCAGVSVDLPLRLLGAQLHPAEPELTLEAV